MTSVRAAKSKGNQLEYNVWWSLKQKYPKTTLTKQLGFQLQYDVMCEELNGFIECKRLKGISWNQLVKFYDKLYSVTPPAANKYIVFQSNHQPALVFSIHDLGYSIFEFEAIFGVPFIKHESTRKINIEHAPNTIKRE